MGDFRLVRKLGEGGMGVVYEAEQQHPRRLVALKVIRGGIHADSGAVKMFEREIHSLARLKHPGIAAIYDSGATAEGLPFYAMELVRGDTLAAWMLRHRPERGHEPVELRVRLGLFRKICDAVAYAHQRGVIHRDLKPSNIVVLREPPSAGSLASGPPVPDVKILDFGLARITDADVQVTVVSEMGRVKGTLPYMSPEQVRGNPDEIDVRTDVYALGVILYEMLAEEAPYDLSRALLPDAVRIICEEPPKPITRTLSGARKLDADVATIVGKALEKEPSRRYSSVTAFAEDIQRYLSDQPILARPPSAAYQFRKLVARHKLPFAFAGVLFVVLLVSTVGLAVQAGRVARERDRANLEAATANKSLEFMAGLFRMADPRVARGHPVTAQEIIDAGASRIDAAFAGEPRVRARLLDELGTVYRGLGAYDRAQSALRAAVALHERSDGPDSLELAESLVRLADATIPLGRPADAVPLARRALEIRSRRLPADSLPVGWAHYFLGAALIQTGSPDTAHTREALRIFEAAVPREDRGVAWALNDLSMSHLYHHEPREALPYAERALAVRRKALAADDPDLAMGINNVGYILVSLGEFDRAEPLIREAVDLSTRINGADHPYTATFLHSLGEVLRLSGRVREAIPVFERVRAIQEATLDPGNFEIPLTYLSLGAAYRDTGRLEDALACFGKALTLREANAGPDHALVAEILVERALALRRLGRSADAAADERRVAAIRAKSARPSAR